jgi:excisionase family DNA binding protein
MGAVRAIRPEQDAESSADNLVCALALVLEPRIKAIAQEVVREHADLQAFSIQETMKRLELSEYTVRKMIANGTLEAVRPTEGTVRITARSVRQILYGDKVGSL